MLRLGGRFVLNEAMVRAHGEFNATNATAALAAAQIAGAVLDVLAQEPPRTDHPLLVFDTCVFSPHSASLGAHTIERMTRMIATQLNLVAEGVTPAGLINSPVAPRFPLMVR